ncbi:hypothetical protein CAPTEDRAFT_209220 [Capitella teleta]|uniref:Uncharacterized protein n=1 Tax=Capitella teleta TaxID=283909 RepID=R7VIL6_CAPTE|nr:hypothetical protein CAPTEDRAFT_209220 [Capitella teleta]|eukprot:ELU18663.1 hypothetical protein CAPTEDRAFT_209220 [Capitella teleta]
MPPLNCSAAATRGPATTSPDDAESASPDSPGMLSVSPPGGGPPNLMKSVSSPSIGPPPKEAYNNNRSRTSKETSNPTAARPPHQPQHHVSIQQLIDDHDAQLANRAASQDAANHGGASMPTDEDVMLNNYLHSNNNHGHLPHGRRSMVELLSETPDDDDEQRPRKDEKKRRSSVFSKLGSYRQKKLVKDPKLKSTHTFVSVSFSNSTACDVCSRSMANKPALQCENCMVNVHDSCRDQIAPCARLSQNSKAATISNDETREKKANSLPEGGSGVSLKGSQSFKEKRATSVPGRVSLQVSHSSGALLPRSSSPISVSGSQSAGTTGYFQWRRVATKLGIDKVISEERDKDKNVAPKEDEGMAHIQLPDITNSMVEAMSASMESLEENSDVPEIEEDVNAEIGACHEAEAWSVTVDKKTLKKLSAKDIKRQDHIWELIQTERRHYRTLSIMQKKFAVGLRREVNLSQDMISRIFPRLEELLEIHRSFVQQLMDRQREKPDKSIDSIGDVLLNQFDGEMGQRMKEAYGEFCSRHNEAVQLYKDLLKQDRKFQAFIKKCKRGDLTKRLGVQECILLVTQRMTKYPLLIEPIIKVTKDNKVERESLEHALILTREVLTFINAQVDAHEKKQRLIDIYHKMEVRSFGMLKGSKFRKSDLLSSNRKLLYEGSIKWMSARGKSAEVLAVILSDVMFFLAESNQKYSFFTHDNKASVISLSKLLVREKGDTRDSKGIYLICQSKKNPEMYELVCRSADGRKAWIRMLKEAVANCPEETEGITSENEEEKKLLEARSVRIRQLISTELMNNFVKSYYFSTCVDQMHHRDQEIQGLCDHKMKLITDLLEVFAKEEITVSRTIYKDDEGQEMMDAEDIQQAILNEATQLSTLFRPFVSRQVSRSGSSASETDQTKASNSSKPKRAETFSGFDRDKGMECRPHRQCHLVVLCAATRVRQRHPSSLQDTESRSNSMINLVDDSSNESLLTVESSINAAQNRLRIHSVSPPVVAQNCITPVDFDNGAPNVRKDSYL